VIVVDTNVISELMRLRPEPAVTRFVAARPGHTLATTTISEAEILYGIAQMQAGRRQKGLAEAAEALFREDFAGRILPFDRQAAGHCAALRASRKAAGRPIGMADAMIAAIARSRGAALATRNTADFAGTGLVVLDPWEAA
jgi:predicted nucleic acid-binding protein